MPDFYFLNPMTTKITIMSTQTQKFQQSTEVYTKDVQKSTIAYALNYNLESKYAVPMFVDVGLQWEDKLIPQVVNASIKDAVGKWNAIDLISNRTKATDEIEQQIKSQLSKRGINVTQLELTDISYDAGFENAVEAKVTAVQRAEEAKNNTVKVQEEANQRIIAAKADAEAMQIKTEALAKSQSLVMYEAVQKWDGHLPQIMTTDSNMLMQLPSMK